ncbi:MAG: site-2 protease family protein [bacterium]
MQIDFIFTIIIFIFSVIIHEVSHGYAAYLQGDNTAKFAGRLTLNPIPHIDPLGSIILPGLLALSGSPVVVGWAKPVPFNPYNLRNQRWGEAIVAVAGPLSNIILAIVFGLFLRLNILSSLGGLFGYIVLINLVLATFNLVPIPPLDGSKILFSILPYRFQKIRNILEQYGTFILIFFVFFLWQFLFPVISLEFKLLTGIVL